MKPRSRILYLLRDLFTFGFAFFVSLYFFKDAKLSRHQWLLFFYLMVLFFLIEFLKKPDIGNATNFKERFVNHVKAYSIFTFLVVVAYFLVPFELKHSTRFLTILISLCLVDFTLNYLLVELITKYKNVYELKHVVVAGTGVMARNIERKLFAEHPKTYSIKGFISCNNDEPVIGKERVLGDLDDIDQYLLTNTVDEIVIAMPSSCTKEIQNVLTIADYHGVRVKYILDYQEMFGQNYRITRLGHVDAVNIRQLPIDSPYASFCKNVFDKVFSIIVLTLLAPVFLVIAAAIKIESRGPVFYFPVRVGRGGKSFKVFKFRSMKENDTASGGTMSTQVNDPRITRVGRILRKYSLDELPQFINVFLGNMSVVGPRPHRKFLNRQLQQSVYKYMVRHYVKPGITGWAQVNGWRGPTDTDEQRIQRTLHDLWYVENWSFWLDIKIVFLTLFSKKVHKAAF